MRANQSVLQQSVGKIRILHLHFGVAPVGVSAANYGMVTDNNLHPWTDEAFADLGVEKPVVFDDVDGLDFEQISDCNPDVILAAYSGMTQEDYDTLSQIAPVIPYKEKAWADKLERADYRECRGYGHEAGRREEGKGSGGFNCRKAGKSIHSLKEFQLHFVGSVQMISAHFMYIFRPIREQHIC